MNQWKLSPHQLTLSQGTLEGTLGSCLLLSTGVSWIRIRLANIQVAKKLLLDQPSMAGNRT